MIGFALFAAWAGLGLGTADHYWSGRPAPPCPHVYVAAIVGGGSPTAGNFRDDAGDCIVWVNTDWSPFNGPEVCKLIVHEVGHLRGLQHSLDPRSVMYPEPTRIPAGCRHLRHRSLPRWTEPVLDR